MVCTLKSTETSCEERYDTTMSEMSGESAQQTIDGRYRIVAAIAEGGMATVYRAVDERLGRTVAVKVIHNQLSQGQYRDQFIERFRREATSAAAIANPHVVQVYDTGESGGRQYLVMEYVHGVNLRRQMSMVGTSSVGEVLRLLAEILDGLGTAHAIDVVHRDIKPENIMINDRGHVQITDFGLAKAVSQETVSTTGMFLGTAAYLAPEMIERNESSPRADLYSVGILVWEMLMGEVPFAGDNAVSMVFKHVHDDVPPLVDACPGIDPAVSSYVAELTARDPQRRPTDANLALERLTTLRRNMDREALDFRHVVPISPAPHDAHAGVAHAEATHAEATNQLPSVQDGMLPANATSKLPQPPSPSTEKRRVRTRTAAANDASTEVFPTATRSDHAETSDSGESAVVSPESTGNLGSPRISVKRRVAVISGIVALLLACFGGGFAWWYYLGPGSYWLMPKPGDLTCNEQNSCTIADVSWKSYESALKVAGIPYSVTEDYSDTIAANNVIATTPAQVNDRVSRRTNAKVNVKVSKGIQQATVPADILKPTSATAKDPLNALKEAGFSKILHDESKDEYSTTLPEGVTLSIDPEPGTTVAHNTAVTVQLSKGPMPVSMPDVVGRTKSDAQAAFDDAKLKASYTEEYSDTVAKGNVISASVKAGTQLHWGDEVASVISKGPETVTIPDVRGQNYDTAEKTLKALGLDVKISAPLGDITHEVRLQSLSPGTQVRVRDEQGKATVITLTVI